MFEPLLDGGAVRQPTGRMRLRPGCVVGDRAYSSPKNRRMLQRRHIRTVSPWRWNQRNKRRLDRETYRQRNRVERCVNRLKQFRRVATRNEKRAHNYLAMLLIAAAMIWLRLPNTP